MAKLELREVQSKMQRLMALHRELAPIFECAVYESYRRCGGNCPINDAQFLGIRYDRRDPERDSTGMDSDDLTIVMGVSNDLTEILDEKFTGKRMLEWLDGFGWSRLCATGKEEQRATELVESWKARHWDNY